MKCSAIRVNGEWRDVWKNPVTDPGKASKRGRMTVLRNRDTGELSTALIEDGVWHDTGRFGHAMVTVWENGDLLRKYALREVRATLDAMDRGPASQEWQAARALTRGRVPATVLRHAHSR